MARETRRGGAGRLGVGKVNCLRVEGKRSGRNSGNGSGKAAREIPVMEVRGEFKFGTGVGAGEGADGVAGWWKCRAF